MGLPSLRRCEEMKSYRFTSVLIVAFRKILRQALNSTRVGGFRACRSLRRFRLASASSSVSRVRDSDLIFGSSSLCAPVHSRSDRYRSFVRPASCLPDQMTRTSVAPTGHKLFISFQHLFNRAGGRTSNVGQKKNCNRPHLMQASLL